MTARIITVGNAAGSAGKTTTVVSIAAIAGRTQRVLVVDADAQANATSWLGATPAITLGDVLTRRASIEDVLTILAAEPQTSAPGVSILGARVDLDGDVRQLAASTGGEQRLRLLLHHPSITESFDLILIDCPGSIGLMSTAALIAADEAWTVTMPTLKELEGVPRFLRLVADVAEAYNPDLRVTAVIPCRVPPPNAGSLYQDAVALMHTQDWAAQVTPTIRQSVRVPEAHALHVPLPIAYPHEPVTTDYTTVWTDHLQEA